MVSKKHHRPKKMVAVVHKTVTGDGTKHSITVTRTGNLNTGKHEWFKGTFANAVKKGRVHALKMGEGTGLWVHGTFASESSRNYEVRNGKLVLV